MGKPVRLRSFDENGVNIALQLLSDQIRNFAPQADTGMDRAAIEAVRNYVKDILAKLDGLVPVARTVNGFPLSEDVALTSDDIEFSGLGRNVTERINEMLVPVNIRGSVQNVVDLPMAGILPQDGFVVLTDETHGNQPWLYVWADWGSGPAWNAVAPFGVDLSNYYTRDETWSAVRIIEDQARQDRATIALVNSTRDSVMLVAEGMMIAKISGNNIIVNGNIERARQAIMDLVDSMLEGLRNDVVPVTRTVNGWPLAKDVALGAIDIEYHDGVSVWQKLNQLESVLSLRHVVDYRSDLPPPFQDNDGAIVRYGETGSAEMWVVIQKEWAFAASFAINMDMWPTRIEVGNWISIETANRMAANETIQNALNAEVERSTLFDDEINERLIREISRAIGAETQLGADVVSMGNNTLVQAQNYARLLFQSIQGIFDNKVDRTFQPSLVTGVSGHGNANNAWLTISRVYLDGTTAAPVQAMLPQASDVNVGTMTPAAFVRLWQMSDWIDNFQIGGTYIDSFPTRAALNAAPHQAWWEPNDWAIVQADETRPDGFGSPQVTRYVLNAGLVWTFANVFGGNMPGLFSNTRAGLIRGTAAGDGNVGALDPATGTARVNGWDNLVGQVGNVRSAIGLDPDGYFNDPATGMNLRVIRNQEAIAAANAGLNDSNSRIAGLETNIGTGPDGLFTTPPAGLNARIAGNAEDIGRNRNDITGLLGRASSIEGAVGMNSAGGFVEPAAGMNGRIADVASDVTALSGRVATVEGNIEGLDGRITENAKNILANAEGITRAAEALEDHDTRITGVQDGLAGKVDRIDVPARSALVSVNVNAQGQVTGGDADITAAVISDFNAAVDARIPAPPAGANLGQQGTQAFGQAARNGTATTFARSDHFHALPAAPDISGLADRIASMEARQGTANLGHHTGTSLVVAAGNCRNVVIFTVNVAGSTFNVSFAAGNYELLMFRGPANINIVGNLNELSNPINRSGPVGNTPVNIGPGMIWQPSPTSFLVRGVVYAFRT